MLGNAIRDKFVAATRENADQADRNKKFLFEMSEQLAGLMAQIHFKTGIHTITTKLELHKLIYQRGP